MKPLNHLRHLVRLIHVEVTSNRWIIGSVAMIVSTILAMDVSLTTSSKQFFVMADETKEVANPSDALTPSLPDSAAGTEVADDEAGTLRELKQQVQQIQQKLAKLEQASAVRPADMVDLVGRLFKHKVPFEIGHTETKNGGRIEIREVWGTRPQIEVGGQYLVRGKYVLPPGEQGKLYFFATASGPWGTAMTYDLQSTTVTEPQGEFELVHGMCPTGQFHLVLTNPDRYSEQFANVYFGTGKHLYR